jgi:uncharacterized protein (DUF362 family)
VSVEQNRSRRNFLKYSVALGVGTVLVPSALDRAFGSIAVDRANALPLDLAVVTGDSPARNCLAALEAMGGMPRFVRPGDRVVIKPNPVGQNPPEDAINTHPDMVETVVKECVRAGAKDVLVISHDEAQAFKATGIQAAVERAGGVVNALERADQFGPVLVPRGRLLRRIDVAKDLLAADVFINMPIAKHHAGSGVTLAMKNLMGVIWDRIQFHRLDLQNCIAELGTAVPQTLILMDANHVLLSNGPVGPGKVLTARQVIAGIDPVAVDAFTCKSFFRDPATVGHIRAAYDLGAGEIDLSKLRIKEFAA